MTLISGIFPIQIIILISFTPAQFTLVCVLSNCLLVTRLIYLYTPQIRNYPRFLHEIARLLRPGGLVLLIEPDLNPAPSPTSSDQVPVSMHGWSTLWETYRTCLRRQGIDITVPQRLSDLLSATGAYENIVVRDGNIPVGFWPQGKVPSNNICLCLSCL